VNYSGNTTVPGAVGNQARFLADTLLLQEPTALPVGPGFEVVLIPEQVARHTVSRLDRLQLEVGAVVAVSGCWGFFVLPESDGVSLSWPTAIEYLEVGSRVTLPPAHWPITVPGSGRTGWIRQQHDGRMFTSSLMLHTVAAAVCTLAGAAA
jgi:hypothetical protein